MNQIVKKLLAGVLAAATLTGCGSTNTAKTQESASDKTTVTVMVDHDFRVDDIGSYLIKKYPDVDFDIVLGRTGVSYLQKAAENDSLPDIIISSGTWGRAGTVLNPYLYDLSTTDIASSFYSVYLDNYTTAEGQVYWLPGCAAIEGVMANRTLFEENGIDLPTDYASFVEVCEKFTELGIRPYASDYKYDYTCAYLLQAWSIPLLQSTEGKDWRLAYEDGETNTLDEKLGLEMFEKLEALFALTGVTEEDETRGYGATASEFAAGNIAMIRQSTNNSGYYDMGLTDLVILPYFGETEEDSWYFTTPSYALALNGELKESDKETVCLDIVRNLFSQECMSLFANEVQAFTCYNKGISFEVKDEFNNIIPFVESNHMYTYLSQDSFQAASLLAVQKMITNNASAQEALAAFNEAVVQPAEQQPVMTTFDNGYDRVWTDHGNEALSTIVNTLTEIADCDIMLVPFSIATGSVYAGDYTSEQIDNLLYGGGVNFYTKELSGAEIKKIVAAAVTGWGSSYDPICPSTLPAVSGCEMVVTKAADGGYQLKELLMDGNPIDEAAVFRFIYTDNSPSLLRTVYGWDSADHDGNDIAMALDAEGLDADTFEGFVYPADHVADYWRAYFADCGKLAAASQYIQLQ